MPCFVILANCLLTPDQIQIDELTSHYGMTPDDYTAVRCGMVRGQMLQPNMMSEAIY